MRISDWSSDVCSSDLRLDGGYRRRAVHRIRWQSALADGQAQRVGRGRDGQRDFDGRHRSFAQNPLNDSRRGGEIAKKEVHAETRRRGGIVRDIDVVSGDVLDLSLRLHRELGPGLLESV